MRIINISNGANEGDNNRRNGAKWRGRGGLGNRTMAWQQAGGVNLEETTSRLGVAYGGAAALNESKRGNGVMAKTMWRRRKLWRITLYGHAVIIWRHGDIAVAATHRAYGRSRKNSGVTRATSTNM